MRTDAFDCTTFVETALALLDAETPSDLGGALDRVRYLGEPAWDHRRHLVAAQWLPHQQEAGRLSDVTVALAGERTSTVVLELSPERWRQSRTARTLALPQEVVPYGSYRLHYVPWSSAVAVLSTIEEPLVLNVVRLPSDDEPLLVRHQALLLPTAGAPVVRHASQRRGRVIDEGLESFVASFLELGGPTLGLNLQRVEAEWRSRDE